MRLKCIACEVLARPIYLCAARSAHIVDIELVSKAQHNHPAKLLSTLQERVLTANGQDYDAVVMGYGLCGKSTHGLVAGAVPLVIPRAHDCITLFLGSRVRYQEQFERIPGTYWYVQDYMERDASGTSLSAGSGMEGDLQLQFEEFVLKYGKDNADYLMETMGAWQQHYQRAAFIDMGTSDITSAENKTIMEAERRGWTYERLTGDLVLLRRLLDGDWEKDFLIVPPGKQITMTYNDNIIGCET
jgi:hypothetical protein